MTSSRCPMRWSRLPNCGATMTTRKPSNADQAGDASIAWRINALKPGQSAFIAKAMATICRKASSLSSMYFSLRARQFGTMADEPMAAPIRSIKSVFLRRRWAAFPAAPPVGWSRCP